IVGKENLKIRIEDIHGNLISEDEAGYHWEENLEHGGHYVYHTRNIQKDERFLGLGDKTCEANLRNKKFAVWATDTYGFEKDQDPIYRAIPFFIGFHHGMGYGIFFDNTFKSYFDFGHEVKEMTSFWADGGEMNFYFIFGPELLKVTEQYTLLTGTPELPPLWALGYHQCKWSYRPESQVREIANEFRTRKIPCDAIYLDIDYMDGFRCFTWNHEHFPNPDKMISDLENDGFKTVVIIDPGIKIDTQYPVFVEGVDKNVFCKRADGYYMKGAVWPGYCYFPDFTKPEAREWWGKQFKGLIGNGIRGIWNDMNEPAVFGFGTMPSDVRHDYDGQLASHRKAHNVYGMQMARATYEGIKKLLYPNRPFNITRSGFSGFQRFASVWTGDNIATWEHLWLANVQCQRLNISGVSFCGTDIGGFIGEPNGELFVRWIQLAVFHPFFRGHSSGDRGEKEPWVFGKELELIAKKFIELRYRLLAYIYTTFWQYVTKGTP
ncbi:MAG: glycosyl hydrolase, partial [Cytophagales bacterium]|nr:glycosyl hydrolase [Cytophagales bacterium]